MRYVFFLMVVAVGVSCQEEKIFTNEEVDYHEFISYKDFKTTLVRVTSIIDPNLRQSKVDALWDSLVANKQTPFVFGDSVCFLYKSQGTSVNWAGDFNRWSPTFVGQKLGDSDIWFVEKTFPQDARLDYKVVVDGVWKVDSFNPFIQYSGFGPNSELRMPLWKIPEETSPTPNIPKGTLSENQMIQSIATNLNYTVQYKVYTPSSYQSMDNLPVIYVTDGHEYADDKLGSMVIVLDNLIHQKKIKPIIAVFVDPRDPNNLSNNRRMQELRANQKFANFLCDELVPAIDATYRTIKNASHRAILGTSLGGWNSAFVGFVRSDVFNLIGIHSPAFDNTIIQNYAESTPLPLKVFMSTGIINDTQNQARAMKSVLEQKAYSLNYKEVNQGHSWGNWKGLLEEPLTYFFASN